MAEPETWLRQAEADLAAARDSLAAGHAEWACYQSQQSAEKALKALLYRHGLTSVLTHSLRLLVERAGRFHPSLVELTEAAKYLEAYFIPTRYPNGLSSDVAPADFFDREDAEKCLSSATSILSAVKRSWPA